jgi:hypothetical protein
MSLVLSGDFCGCEKHHGSWHSNCPECDTEEGKSCWKFLHVQLPCGKCDNCIRNGNKPYDWRKEMLGGEFTESFIA